MKSSEVRIYGVIGSSFSERVSHYLQRACGIPYSEGSVQDAQQGRDAVEVRELRGVSTLLKVFMSRLFIAVSRP